MYVYRCMLYVCINKLNIKYVCMFVLTVIIVISVVAVGVAIVIVIIIIVVVTRRQYVL